jgi:hypothetical protein
MSRYIEIRPDDALPEPLVLAVGDVVRLAATGARVLSGRAVELVGILTEGVVGTDGSVLTPLGPPGVVLFRAREPGDALVRVVTGDPFGAPADHDVAVRVGT